MDELGKSLANLPATLFSPAKMVYVAYILLMWKQKVPWSLCEFLGVSVFFLVVEIGHNDWGRIRLNNHANETTPDWEKPEWWEKKR